MREIYTARAGNSFSPWNDTSTTYTLGQVLISYNSLSNLQVASMLNVFDQATYNWHYNKDNCINRFYPKLYLGPQITYSQGWNYNNDFGAVLNISRWPEIN